MAKRRKRGQQKAAAPEPADQGFHPFAFDRTMRIPLAVAFVSFLGAVLLFPFPAAVHDAYAYQTTALRLIQDHVFAFSGELPGSPVVPNANVTPGVIMFLAGLLLPFASPFTSAGVASTAIEPWLVGIQFLMALGIVAAVVASARMLGGRGPGLYAGLLAAFYLPFAWASTVSLAEQLGTLLFAWQVCVGLFLVDTRSKNGPAGFFAYGALTAATLMFRPALVLWAPVPLVYALLVRRYPTRRLAQVTLATAVGFALLFAPWWVRNQGVVGHFVPFRTNETVATLVTPAVHDPGPAAFGPAVAYPDVSPAEAEHMIRVIDRQGSATAPPLVQLSTSLSTPWVPQLAVMWEDVFHPDSARFAYVQPWTYSLRGLIALAEVMRVYQWVLLLLASASLLMVRRNPGLWLVWAAPVLVVAAHYTTQLTVRYLYPVMPAIVILAAFGLHAMVGIGQRSQQARLS